MDGGGAERHWKTTMNQGWLAAVGGEDGLASGKKKLDQLPERFINRYVLVLTIALMTVRGLGFLAFAWSTVVLLGGFVTLLGRLDFWFITLISFAMSARIFGAVADEQYLYLVELLSRPIIGACFRNKEQQSATTPQRSYQESNEEPHACSNWFPSLGMKDATTVLIKIGLQISLVLVVLHPVFVLFNIVASFVRLWRKDYGQEANLKPAVVIFYSLAFSQGVLYLLWLILDAGKVFPVRLVVKKYGFHDNFNLGTQYVRQYLIDTKFKCLKDLSAIEGRNLITYASSLLDSDYMEKYLCGERILVYFIEREMLPMQDLIRSSRKRIQKLIMMLSWTDPDQRYQEARLLASKIVAHVAGHVSIAQFPGTLESVSSLLAPSESNHILFRPSAPDRRGNEADHNVQINIDADGKRECQLIVQGLIILEKFTLDGNNSIEMCKSDVLLIHILAWICSKPFIPINEQVEWIDILTRCFKVLIELTCVRGQAGNEVRKKVKFELEPSWINGYGSQPDIQMLAIDLHTQVFLTHYFEEPLEFIINNSNPDKHKQNKPSLESDNRVKFLRVILKIFLSYKEKEGTGLVASRKVQVKAGEAIAMVSAEEKNYKAMLKEESGIVIELYNIMCSEIDIEYRATAADIFKRFYANAATEPKKVLQKVLDLLCTSMESETLGNGDDLPVYPGSSKHPDSKCNQQINYVKKLQAALLRIICLTHLSRYITAKDLVDAAGSVSYKSGYVGLLKELVDRNKRGTTAYPIEIVKLVAKIVDLIIIKSNKTELVQQIRQKGIVGSLIQASNIMSGVDSWTIFRHIHQRGVVWNKTLAEIVGDIENRTY